MPGQSFGNVNVVFGVSTLMQPSPSRWMQYHQFEDFDGRLRTLAYEPTVTDGPQEAPFYEQMMRFPIPDWVAYNVHALAQALR